MWAPCEKDWEPQPGAKKTLKGLCSSTANFLRHILSDDLPPILVNGCRSWDIPWKIPQLLDLKFWIKKLIIVYFQTRSALISRQRYRYREIRKHILLFQMTQSRRDRGGRPRDRCNLEKVSSHVIYSTNEHQ